MSRRFLFEELPEQWLEVLQLGLWSAGGLGMHMLCGHLHVAWHGAVGDQGAALLLTMKRTTTRL